MNHEEVVNEDERKKRPANYDAKRKRVEWEQQKDDLKKVFLTIIVHTYLIQLCNCSIGYFNCCNLPSFWIVLTSLCVVFIPHLSSLVIFLLIFLQITQIMCVCLQFSTICTEYALYLEYVEFILKFVLCFNKFNQVLIGRVKMRVSAHIYLGTYIVLVKQASQDSIAYLLKRS